MRSGISAFAALAVFAWGTSAAAYCRTMSCELGEQPAHPCPRDDNGCVTQGVPLHWASSCLNYAVQMDGSAKSNLDADQIEAIAEQAFLAWKSAKCPGGGSPNFEVHFQGFVSCDRREAVCGTADANVNVIMLHDTDWPYAGQIGGSDDIGVTTPVGSTKSGLIVDADVEVNSENFGFKPDPSSAMMNTSLLYVFAHEFGHFLGLAHSNVAGALMIPRYQSVAMSVNLVSADDAAAICAAYPPGPALTCTASSPAYDTCQVAAGADPPCNLAAITHPKSSCSCDLAGTRSSSAPSLAALSALILTLVRRRRAR